MAKIYVTLNTKGGVGKSTFAQHLIPEYIKRTKGQASIDLYEFNEHSQSSELIQKSSLVSFKVVTNEDLQTEMVNIRYDSRNESIIIDAGAGKHTVDIIESARRNKLEDKLIFVIPFIHGGGKPLTETIDLIKGSIDNPKILLGLNACESLDPVRLKKKFIFLYGNKAYDTKPLAVMRTPMEVGAVPEITNELEFANILGMSMSEIASKYSNVKDFDDDELIAIWSKEDGVEEIDRERYAEKIGIHMRQLDVYEKIQKCDEFFDALERLEAK